MNNIIITCTTYPKRDKYLYDVLKDIWQRQTIKPNKVLVYLAKEEYDSHNLPESILKCVNNNLCEIRWTYNSYCHKRHLAHLEYDDDYIITIDDDMLYPSTYIEELYTYAKTNNCIVEYIGFYDNYVGTKREPVYVKNKEYQLSSLSGATICFPPNSFPMESLNYNEVRDKICPTCDESWIQCFLIKNNQSIHILHSWKDLHKIFKHFDGSQEETMHHFMSNNNNGVRYREKCFCEVIKFLHIEDKIHKLLPKLDIDGCIKNYNK